MPKCVFERATGIYVAGTSHDDLTHNPATHVQLDLPEYPDRRTARWDGAAGVRAATGPEIAAYDAGERDSAANKMELWLRATLRVLAPKIVPAMTPQDLITAVRAEYRSLLDQ